MPILLFLLWLMFNERISVDVIIAGVLVVALLSYLLKKLGLWSMQNDMQVVSRIPAMIGFVIRLVYEVFKANIHMVALVLSPNPNERIKPKILKHKNPIKTDAGRVALANSITLTPGTVTVDVGDDYVYVHAIDEYAEQGLENSVLQMKIEGMEKDL